MKSRLLHLLLIPMLSAAQLRAATALAESNLALTTRYFTEVYCEAKFDLIDELFAEDYTHTSTNGRSWTGRDRLHQVVNTVVGMMPDPKPRILEAVADDGKVMLLVQFEADAPEVPGVVSKVERVSFPEVFVFWVRDGKIYKGRSAGSHLELIKQASGFQGTMQEVIAILAREVGSGKKQD